MLLLLLMLLVDELNEELLIEGLSLLMQWSTANGHVRLGLLRVAGQQRHVTIGIERELCARWLRISLQPGLLGGSGDRVHHGLLAN